MASVNTSVIFDLGGSHYLARPIRMPTNRESFLENGFKSKIPSLVTYFSVWNTHTIDAGALQKWRAEYLDQDDVFQPKFLQGIIFGGVESNEVQLTRDAETLLEVWKTVSVVYEPHLELKDGPYYITGGTFHSTWQIYEDRQLAFLQETWPTDDGNGTVEQVNAPGNGYRSHEIAIPARYYSQNIIEPDPTVKKNHTPSPLHGMRVAIKDNFHISGTKTSLGNLAYYETYSVRNDTADVVLELLDAGVHIVGKMHLSPFAMMEHLMQSVDYQAPFNPRGGGYLIAGGSSGASAAAVAAYDWLDLSICSDTTGSARIPALQVGVFGFRPSSKSISGKGLVKAWPAFDTPAWMGRDLGIFPHILRALHLPGLKAEPEIAKKSYVEILYPTDFIPKDSPDQEHAMDDFIEDFVKSSGCAYRKISIKEDWRKTSPVGEKDFQQYLYNKTLHGWYYSAYHSFDDFRQRYEASHGHAPFVTDVVKWYWNLGSQVTLQEHEEIMNRLSIFKSWFIDHYMNGSQTTIIALHVDKVQPRYRNQYPGNNNPIVPGIRPTFLAAVLGAPELAVPICQISYQSLITGKTEKLPVVVSLLGPPGNDMKLTQWSLDAMRASGRPTTVKTGKTTS